MVEAQVVESLVVQSRVVAVLPGNVEVVHEGLEPQSPVLEHHDRTTGLPEFPRGKDQRSGQGGDGPGMKCQRDVHRVREVVAGVDLRR